MEKIAKNEALKLRASFYNNLAVGLFVAAVLLPSIAFLQLTPEDLSKIPRGIALNALFATLAAAALAALSRQHAEKIIQTLID